MEKQFVDLLITGFAGLASALLGLVLRNLSRLDAKINDLAVKLAERYVSKEEFYHAERDRRIEERRMIDLGHDPERRRAP